MLCRKPFMGGASPFGCGQCLPCRINKARQKMWRQYFESLMHEENCFVTLTYDNDHLPEGGNLQPLEAVKWIRSLRDWMRPRKIRYFLVGEYGELSLRPHYHLSVFGVSKHSVIQGQPFHIMGSKLWPCGFVHIAEFNELTAQYVAGYIVKKLKDRRDQTLKNLVPEFARMSLKPGLGATAMSIIAAQLSANSLLFEKMDDVPRVLKIGKRSVPLDRYLLRKLREAVGYSDEYIAEIKKKACIDRSLDMRVLFQNTEFDEGDFPTPKKAYAKSIAGKLDQIEWRSNQNLKGKTREAL